MECISAQFLPQKISLPVPFTKFEGNKSEHLEQLFVTLEIIAKKIKKMKDNKSPGVDGIPPKLLMEIVEQISTPLAKNFLPNFSTKVLTFADDTKVCRKVTNDTDKQSLQDELDKLVKL